MQKQTLNNTWNLSSVIKTYTTINSICRDPTKHEIKILQKKTNKNEKL